MSTPAAPHERSASAAARELAAWLADARERTLALVQDLEGEQWLGPRLASVNPPRWELGHVGWFQEWWCLRAGGAKPSLRADADRLYDSAAIPQQVRWDLPLPDPEATRAYLADVLERVLVGLERRGAAGDLSEREAYFLRLAVFHEDMHAEALFYARQTHGYAPPAFAAPPPEPPEVVAGAGAATPAGDVVVPGGRFVLGARPGEAPFVFDNEKWGHEVEIQPFAIARCAVSEGEIEVFVEERGYRRPELWSKAGWDWREREQALAPLYWRKDGARWWRRRFDRWVPAGGSRAMVHFGWFEAEAFCRWAGRRLPTEAEWERAACYEPGSAAKRARPWGAAAADSALAHLDARSSAPLGVEALPGGDSALGCRQLWGNVWEWTADDFAPYPGFVVDPYREYSAPWFPTPDGRGTHKVLRGGCFATPARLLRSTWRNFYTPDRRDVWAGLRTCAVKVT